MHYTQDLYLFQPPQHCLSETSPINGRWHEDQYFQCCWLRFMHRREVKAPTFPIRRSTQGNVKRRTGTFWSHPIHPADLQWKIISRYGHGQLLSLPLENWTYNERPSSQMVHRTCSGNPQSRWVPHWSGTIRYGIRLRPKPLLRRFLQGTWHPLTHNLCMHAWTRWGGGTLEPHSHESGPFSSRWHTTGKDILGWNQLHSCLHTQPLTDKGQHSPRQDTFWTVDWPPHKRLTFM